MDERGDNESGVPGALILVVEFACTTSLRYLATFGLSLPVTETDTSVALHFPERGSMLHDPSASVIGSDSI